MRTSEIEYGEAALSVWPYGLGFNLLLGAGSVLLTIRRLRTPAVAPPRGTRVA